MGVNSLTDSFFEVRNKYNMNRKEECQIKTSILKVHLIFCNDDLNNLFRIFVASKQLNRLFQNMGNIFSDNQQIEVVSSFSELVNTSFQGMMNAICWHRNLVGNFKEIVSQLQLNEDVTVISAQDLLALQLSEEGDMARKMILNDLQLLNDFGASPVLNLLKCYERDEELGFISTDVYSYHVDRSPIGTDTFLCTYHGAASDIIPNDHVEQKILIPEIREQLKKLHDGPEEEFEDFLREYFFDLHYQPKPNAEPVNLGKGHLWRIAVDHPEQQALPCVHRAPVENDGEYRLLLIC